MKRSAPQHLEERTYDHTTNFEYHFLGFRLGELLLNQELGLSAHELSPKAYERKKALLEENPELVPIDPEPCDDCETGITYFVCHDEIRRCRNCVRRLAEERGWDLPLRRDEGVVRSETESLGGEGEPDGEVPHDTQATSDYEQRSLMRAIDDDEEGTKDS